MQQDRIRWNQKYTSETHPRNPSTIVKQFYTLAPKGRVLDIAAGTGRNALFLAKHGFCVDAVDISDVGLKRVPGRHANLNLICTDLDVFEIPREHYSLILNIRFLDRRLFPYICEGLKRGGLLIFETYLAPMGETADGPSRQDHMLRRNELLHAFLSFQILFYQESRDLRKKNTEYLASLVGMKER